MASDVARGRASPDNLALVPNEYTGCTIEHRAETTLVPRYRASRRSFLSP